MSNARVLPLAIERATREGFFDVRDPGASGVLTWGANAHAIYHIVTAGAEGRTLDSANKFAVGSTVLVNLAKAVGTLTITYNGATTLALPTAGQFALFICLASDPTTNPETRTWGLVSSSVAGDGNEVTAAAVFGTDVVLLQSDGVLRGAKATAIASANVVTRAANAASAGLVPQSGGADKSLAAITPVALGSFTVTTGDATTNAKLVLIINKLVALGLFTGTAS